MKKSFAILGLGRFGRTLARELTKAGMDVLAVDINKAKVNLIADDVTCAIQADVKDTDTIKSLGLSNMDAVIVAMTEDVESAIMAIIQAKELGVPMVIAKAKNNFNKEILTKVGADKVVFPEKESGIRIARNLVSNNIIDYFGINEFVSVVEITAKSEWIGKSLKELNLRKKYKINVVGIKYDDIVVVDIEPSEPIREGAVLVVIGNNDNLKKF